MASKTNCIKNGIPYYRIRRTVGKKLNKDGQWVDDIKEFYGKNKSDAEQKYEAYKKKKNAGMTLEKKFFGVMADFFIYQVFMNDSRFSAGTKERYEQVYRLYIKPMKTAGLLLEKVTTQELQYFYNTVNCSNATLKAIHNIMGHFYKYLEKEGYCRNLTVNLVLPKKKDSKEKKLTQEITVWSDKDLKKIIENLDNSRIRLLIILAVNTGCRIGELLGLRYGDVREGKLFIDKKLSSEAQIEADAKKTRKFEISEPKTASSIRNIPLSEKTLAEVEKHKTWHNKEMLANGYRTEYIFTTQSGKFYDRHNINRACRRYYKSIGVEFQSFHTYRHTFCTNLCKNGVPLQTAYKLMGHKSINVTAQYYTNVDDKEKQEAINKVDLLFN